MCGICGYIGYTPGYKYVFHGIKMLLNRGYDSTGMCGINNKQLLLKKFASLDNKEPIERLEEVIDDYSDITSPIIAHTRWATCGAKTDINSHPHNDYTNRFSIVHNGIIENHLQIKKELIEKYSIKFQSTTDTEVIINLISVMYDKYKDIHIAMKHAFQKLEGTWGIVLISILEPDKLYCARHGSSLLVGFNDSDNYMMVASEQSGFSKYINCYVTLNDNDIVILKKQNDKCHFQKIDFSNNYEIRQVTTIDYSVHPDPYPYWTLKEINEQAECTNRAINMGSRILNDSMVKLGGLERYHNYLTNIDNLILLGCGTSYNAGLYVSHQFKQISGFNTVQVFDGAEFEDYDIPKTGTSCLILISQSGETHDLYRCMTIAKRNNVFTIGVINVIDSLIAREVDCGVYINAGREVGVASTKAFTSQSVVLHLIAIYFAQILQINEVSRRQIICDIRQLSIDINNTIQISSNCTKHIAKYLLDKNSLFIIGKGIVESIAKEGSLKIKEIGYIHSEAYSSSSLKHGPFSLLNKDTPVIILTPNDKHFKCNQSIVEEIITRNSTVFGISNVNLDKKYNKCIKIPNNNTFTNLLMNIPLQFIAYELAVIKGTNPDKPKNLAKTITV